MVIYSYSQLLLAIFGYFTLGYFDYFYLLLVILAYFTLSYFCLL
jgi:hypothetical protein